MRTCPKFLILFALSLPAPLGQANPREPIPQGIVKVSSEFYDECQGKFVREVGTGVILRNAGPSLMPYLVTTSHLSQGRNLTIDDQPASKVVKSRLANNLLDEEVMELDSSRLRTPVFGQFELARRKITSMWGCDVDLTSPQSPTLKLANAPLHENTPFAVVPQWSDQALVEAQTEAQHLAFGQKSKEEEDPQASTKPPSKSELIRQSEIGYLAIGGQVVAPGRVAPGMSGGPLIVPDYNSCQIRGLASEYIVDMKNSYFVSDREVLKLLSQLESGKTGKVGPTVWRRCNGVMYKDMGNGKREIADPKTNNGVRPNLPSGKEYAPPGKEYAPPGTEYAPPGKEYTPPGTEYAPPGVRDAHIDTVEEVDPSFTWNGKVGSMFKIQLRPGAAPIYLPPITSSFVLANQLEKAGIPVDVVPPNTPIIDLLSRKLKGPLANSKNFLATSESKIHCMKKEPLIEREGDRIRVLLFGPPPSHEPIEFMLDALGRRIHPETGAPMSQRYHSRIEVKGARSGKTYIVKLGELFHTDLSNLVYRPNYDLGKLDELEKTLDSGNRKQVAQAVEKLIANYQAENGAFISYREKGSPAQYRFEVAYAGPRHKPNPDSGCRDSRLLQDDINLLKDPSPLCEIFGR